MNKKLMRLLGIVIRQISPAKINKNIYIGTEHSVKH